MQPCYSHCLQHVCWVPAQVIIIVISTVIRQHRNTDSGYANTALLACHAMPDMHAHK
jgi:ABC-type polysaccharide transport system permease subunit